ncbi:cephalosporin hydroxylase family protein [Chachezhania antarctica]|uniref:cephalosporin hydroxylase family protein n=1 Tax=Chachezhania antarctica TaxID=2340860 RepID=UPI000EADF700|nr:CmcI family methyltransferase [Chachezhania antarctica]|tara:strand:+ start:5433 stop:6254 length:822 start_codon:yes stop_codon:yes gene_type:complete
MTQNDPIAQFVQERTERIATYPAKSDWQAASNTWMETAFREMYMYNFAWAGRPIIQVPADIVGFQELVWETRPDVILETGIAHGGSLMLSASLLSMLDVCDALEAGTSFNPAESKRKVIGIDIDIREHNRNAIESHPLSSYIEMVQGSSIDKAIADQAEALIPEGAKVMVALDSNHTHDHVMGELELYAPLTSKDSICVVFDTVVEDMPEDMFPNRPWAPGDNPKTAVWKYLELLNGEGRTARDGDPLKLEMHTEALDKLMLTVCPDGILKRV